LDKNPKQKVKVKVKEDGSYTFTTPGIPATTSSKLDSSAVPKQSAKSAANRAEMFTALEEIQAKIAALTQGLETGSFDAEAADLARQKIDELKGKVVTIQTALKDAPVPKNSPLDAAATLKLERMRQLDRALNMNLDPAEREMAKAQVKALDRRIKSNERATIPASEEDITAAVLGQMEEPEVPLSRIAKPTRTLSREEVEAGPSAPAPAPAAAVEALTEALADPAVAAVVEQASVSTKKAKDPLANMRRVAEEARRATARDAANAKQEADNARLKEYMAAVEALPEVRSRRTVEQDFAERERIGQSSREEGAKFIRMANEAAEKARAKAEAEQDREDRIRLAAPTIQGLFRGKKARKTARVLADSKRAMIDKAIQDQLREEAGVSSFVGDTIRDSAADAAAAEDAASKIQRMIRARRGREAERLSEYKRVTEERARKQMESTAASTIQEYVRRALARDELKSRAERAYRPAQGPVYDEEAANVRDAALRIQSLFRGNRTRKELAEAAKSAALEGITQTLSRGNDEAAKQAAMNKMLDDMFEGSIPTVDRTDDIQRDAAAKIQSAFRNRVRRRPPGEQAELDAQYAALFNRMALDEIQENVMKAQREKAQADLDAQYAALFAEGDIDKMRERVIQTHREKLARRTPMLSDQELAVAKAFAEEVAAQREIEVPGTNIRPDTRTIPVPPPIPPLPIRYSEPVPKRTRASASVKRLEKAAAETGQSIPVMNFVRDLVTDTLRQVVDEDVASKAQARIEAQDLQEQRSRLRPVVTEEEVRPVVQNLIRDVVADALAARRASVGPDAPPDDSGEDWDTDPKPVGLKGTGLVGGVLRRLRGMGYFNTMDITPTRVYGTPMDNKKLLADAKAAYAAKGGRMGDDRTDFRVLMDAMKTIPRIKGGAIGGRMTGGYPIGVGADSDEYKLHYVAFPDDKWTTSSSLRWLRSNGIVPIKKAMHIPEYYKYQIMPPSDNKDYIGHELAYRGRKILLGYARP
jgi:hypothetical protein